MTPEQENQSLRAEVHALKHQLDLVTRHKRAMSGCLKLIAALPVCEIGCYYELRAAHRLAIKGAWYSWLGQNDHIFLPAANVRFDQKLHSTEAHKAEALIRRNRLASMNQEESK